MSDSARVPHNLRRYVVEQDYAQYTEVDQAVWRFVLLQTYQRLQHTAHPAYREGLAQTGISVERIPRVADMSACLERFGWRAVCVDGFIPPRAFQEFQAASILPIAADIRSKDHLVYTPAPDIIHEAAGHAPILPDARYAAYLRAIGEVGKKAFSSPEDARVYAAIFDLSEVKETRGVRPEAVTAAEQRLERALAALTFTSEASRLSRLYWWTAEYGLVGTPSDYRLYGAGLLSSLWESHACHDTAVRKLPLSAACVEQGYDITRTQPQLFVARDFEHLFDVLAEVEGSLAHRAGGDRALAAALRSEEIATLHFRDDRFVTGQLSAVSGTAAQGVLSFAGRVGLGAQGRLQHVFEANPHGYRVPVGPLAGGLEFAAQLRETGRRVTLRFTSGVELKGELALSSRAPDGRVVSARFLDYQLGSAQAGFSERGAEYLLLVAPELLTAHAGATDADFFPPAETSHARVPKPRSRSEREQALLALYERSIAAFRAQLGSAAVNAFRVVHHELQLAFPDEWLLRWNLLECLCKLAQGAKEEGLGRTLECELLALELKFSHREPIASGLRYLSALAA
ncbi:MAG: aromatic amino acid hydroxylase [Polyangiaceae bacterium]